MTTPSISDELVSPFLDLLQILRQTCGGDLDKHIILLAIAERSLRDPAVREISEEQRFAGLDPVLLRNGINARSIADSTGVPRETVRRKVAELLSLGWIGRTGRRLHYTGEGYRALTAAREGLARMALQCAVIVDRHGLAPTLERPG